MRHKIGFLLGIIVFILFLILPPVDQGNPVMNRSLAVTSLMAIWWISEAIPIPVTALLPLALFPLLGVMSSKSVAPEYMNSNIFLFVGGFIIALAIEKWNLHKRIALNIINLIGDRPSQVILGVMFATAFLSMWISNTATTMMMLPIGISIIAQMQGEGINKKTTDAFALSLMISIAYAANIGGIATLIGTPPNIVFSQIFRIAFPEAPEISFLQWMLFAFPLMVVFLIISWFLLTRFLIRLSQERLLGGKGIIEERLQSLGKISTEERRVLYIFLSTALLWIFRKNLHFGVITIPGWTNLLGIAKFVDDGSVSIGMATLLFLIPARKGSNEKLIDWQTAVKLPWGIIILFGGGFALAAGLKQTGVNAWIGDQFNALAGSSPYILTLISSSILTFMTELTSNTATAQMALPILASVAVGIKTHPFLLMLPATISASFAFMLPVATPPNAIVFGSGYIPIQKMVKFGLIMNLIGIILVFIVTYTLARPVLDISLSQIPAWVH